MGESLAEFQEVRHPKRTTVEPIGIISCQRLGSYLQRLTQGKLHCFVTYWSSSTALRSSQRHSQMISVCRSTNSAVRSSG